MRSKQLRRRREAEASALDLDSASPHVSGLSGSDNADTVQLCNRVVVPPADVDKAVELCLSDARPLAERFSETVFVKSSAHNIRAIAARLYQQRHGDTFAQLQRLFALEDGRSAFFRQPLTKLDEGGTDMAFADVGLRIKHNAIQARS